MEYLGRSLSVESTTTLFSNLKLLEPAKDENTFPRSIKHVLHPNWDAKPKMLPDNSQDPIEYLRINKMNMLAEYAAFLKEAHPIKYKGTVRNVDDETIIVDLCEYESGKDADLSSLGQHLFVLEGRLCLTNCQDGTKKGKKGKESCTLALRKGERWNAKVNQAVNRAIGFIQIIDLGYIGDVMMKLIAVECQLSQDPSPLLSSIASPRNRQKDSLLHDSHPDIDSAKVPINEMQEKVIRDLKYNVEGIQGPPGTGKSTIIYHIVKSALHVERTGSAVLATCVQNKATEAICEKMLNGGDVKFFVFGNEERLGVLAKQWTVQAQVERHPVVVPIKQRLRKLESVFDFVTNFLRTKRQIFSRDPDRRERRLRATQLFPGYGQQEKRDGWISRDLWRICWVAHVDQKYSKLVSAARYLFSKVNALKIELRQAKEEAFTEIATEASLVICTVASIPSLLRNEDLHVITSRIESAILDEAGTTPETLVPVLLLFPLQRLIAVGDQKQLAPFSLINDGKSQKMCHGFQKGFCRFQRSCKFSHDTPVNLKGVFQRIEEALPRSSIPCLIEQYRMHAKGAQLVSELFYSHRLRTPQSVADVRQGLDPQGIWLYEGLSRTEEIQPPGRTSYTNPEEAQRVVELLNAQTLINKNVAVITFYKGQEKFIRQICENSGWKEHEGVRPAHARSNSFRVMTVDQSQGSEADVVIISCVRSNDDCSIGFLNNSNRTNVAISRFKERMIILCDRKTFSRDRMWTRILNACRSITSTASLPRLPS